MLGVSLLLGATMLIAVATVYWWALRTGRSEGETRAMAFAAIVVANVALLFVTRSAERTVLATLPAPNPALWWITLGALGALVAAIYIAPVAEVFRFAPLAPRELGAAAAAGIVGVAWYELRQLLRR